MLARWELALKRLGRAGVARWKWPYPGTKRHPSGPAPKANLPQSLAAICAQDGQAGKFG
jgi:hypothetical protein